jgi:putative sigma-54 modulation protein
MGHKAKTVDIDITLRHMNGDGAAVKEYVSGKLGGVVSSLPTVQNAAVKITYEPKHPRHQQYVVQATLQGKGTLMRAEETGGDPRATIDSVRDVLERRIRDWKGRLYFQGRRESAALKGTSIAQLPLEVEMEPVGEIVRTKSHETKPMFPEDAIEQMELLGHDFFLFLNAESGQHNVVYRRNKEGYGVIEPTV